MLPLFVGKTQRFAETKCWPPFAQTAGVTTLHFDLKPATIQKLQGLCISPLLLRTRASLIKDPPPGAAVPPILPPPGRLSVPRQGEVSGLVRGRRRRMDPRPMVVVAAPAGERVARAIRAVVVAAGLFLIALAAGVRMTHQHPSAPHIPASLFKTAT
jgi:hypothetical protein